MLEFKSILHDFQKEFPRFAEKFQAFCKESQVDQKKLFDLEVSLEELISNSFAYGNPKGPVIISTCIRDNEIKITVKDFAPPFNLLRQAPDLPQGKLEERNIGGLGIHLVKNLSDRVEYSGSRHGNQVTLFKAI